MWFSGTPEYSVLQIRKAVETNNPELGLKYIDVDSVFENFWADEIESKILTGKSEELGGLNAIFGFEVAENTKLAVKEQISRGIESWFLVPAEEEPGEGGPAVGVLPGEKEKIEIVKQDDTAYLEQLGEVKIIFTQKEGERYWVISKIEGFLNLLSRSE